MLRNAVLYTCVSLTLSVVSTANAAEPNLSPDRPPLTHDDGEASTYSWGLGIAALSQQQAYTDIDRNNFAIPLLYFENRWLELMGPWLDLKLPSLEWGENQELKFALRTQLFGFDGYESDDTPILSGMEVRKAGIFAGPSFKWSNPIVDVFGEWQFDTSGNSEGQRATLGFERQFHFGNRFIITPSITATWMDKKYTDYYYGVSGVEALVDRPIYSVEGSNVSTEFALRADYMFDQRQGVFLQAGYTALGDKIEDSPLTDRSSESMIFFGYLYRFK